MQSALDIATYVIHQYWMNGESITNLKLQKILYYVQGYVSKRCNEPAYPEGIYNWPYGPVVQDVYYEYNQNRANPIGEPEETALEKAQQRLKRDDAVLRVIDQVIRKSYDYTASDLVSKTHEEDPWGNTSEREEISYAKIAKYFRDHDPLGLAEVR